MGRLTALRILAAAAAITSGSSCGRADDPTMVRGEGAGPTTSVVVSEDDFEPVPASAASSNWPDCRDVWVVGELLPDDYGGCTKRDVWVDEQGRPAPSRSFDAVGVKGDGLACRDGGFLVRGWFADGHVMTPTGSSVVGRLTMYFARLGGRIESDVWAPNGTEDVAFEAAVAECRTAP